MDGDCSPLYERDIFDQQTNQTFAFPVGKLGILPYARKVCCQCLDCGFLLVIEQPAIGLALALVFRLNVFQRTQLRVPIAYGANIRTSRMILL